MLSYANGAALDAADTHLAAADPVMADLIRRFGPVDEDLDVPLNDLYGALILAITSQQLSTHSARAIYGRLTARFGGRTPSPEDLLADDPDTLRTSTGLSHAKVASLRSLAEHIVAGDLDLGRLRELGDDEATQALVAIKGIGEWTASVFLIFTLHRPDVLARGDLVVRTAAMRAYGLDAVPDPATLTGMGEYLWEPVPGCWSIRRRAAGPGPAAAFLVGAGEWGRDSAPFPHPWPPPFTTLAWRLAHLSEMLTLRADHMAGSQALTRDDYRCRGDAAGGIAAFDTGAEAWRAVLVSADDAALDAAGRSTYPYGSDPEDPFIETAWWVNQEVLHHSAEIALLRDLYRAQKD